MADDIASFAAVVVNTAMELFYTAIGPMVSAEIEKAFAPGGALYEQIVASSIGAASSWYGMYAPKVYHRGMTFTDPGNIQVSSGGITVTGQTWQGTWNVTNTSPHAGFSDGFPMRGGAFRPGGYIVANGEHFTFDVSVDDSAAQDVFGNCVRQAIQQFS